MSFWQHFIQPPREDRDHTYDKIRADIRREFQQQLESVAARERNLLEMERDARRTVLMLLLSVEGGIRVTAITRALADGPLMQWVLIEHTDVQTGDVCFRAVRR